MATGTVGHSIRATSIGYAAALAANVAGVVVLARLLDPAVFGQMSTAMVVIGVSEAVVLFGIAPALVQLPDVTDRDVSVGVGIALAFGILVAMLVAASAGFYERWVGVQGVASLLAVLSVVFVLRAVGGIFEAVCVREFLFGRVAFANAVGVWVGQTGLAIALAVAGWGVWALATGYIARVLLTAAILGYLGPCRVRVAFEWQPARRLLRSGAGFTWARLANYAANQGDYLVVARMLGAEALGFYSKAYQLMALPARAFQEVAQKVLFSEFSRGQRNQARLERQFLKALAVTAAFALPLSLFIVIGAPAIVSIALGDGWDSAVIPLMWIGGFAWARIQYKIPAALLKGLGLQVRLGVFDGVFACVVAIGTVTGAYLAGLPGAAAGVGSAILLHYLALLAAAHFAAKIPITRVVIAHGLGALHVALALAFLFALERVGVIGAIVRVTDLLFLLLVTFIPTLLTYRWLRVLLRGGARDERPLEETF